MVPVPRAAAAVPCSSATHHAAAGSPLAEYSIRFCHQLCPSWHMACQATRCIAIGSALASGASVVTARSDKLITHSNAVPASCLAPFLLLNLLVLQPSTMSDDGSQAGSEVELDLSNVGTLDGCCTPLATLGPGAHCVCAPAVGCRHQV